jgi:hypothetical protein
MMPARVVFPRREAEKERVIERFLSKLCRGDINPQLFLESFLADKIIERAGTKTPSISFSTAESASGSAKNGLSEASCFTHPSFFLQLPESHTKKILFLQLSLRSYAL